MSEEEKKAYDNLIMLKYFTMEKEDKEAIQVILNLIDKQQKEIEELKNTETYKIAIIDKDKYVSKDKIREKIKELEKKEENIEEIDVSRIKFAELILENILEENNE